MQAEFVPHWVGILLLLAHFGIQALELSIASVHIRPMEVDDPKGVEMDLG
jgi:hypothetical protein